jgi:PAS domain S-box-containing protein
LYQNLRLRWKLLLAFGLIVGLLLGQGLLVLQTTRSNRAAAQLVQHTLTVVHAADDARVGAINMQTAYRGYMLTGDDTFLTSYDTSRHTYQTALADLVALTTDNPEQAARWQSIDAQMTAWQQQVVTPGLSLRQEALAGLRGLYSVVAFAQNDSDRQLFTPIRQTFTDATAAEEALLTERSAAAERENQRLQNVIVWGSALTIGIAVLIACGLAWSLGRAVGALADAAQEISAGNLTRRVGLTRRDELGRAAAAFDEMATRLERAIRDHQLAAETARAGEAQVRAVMDGVAEGILTVNERGKIATLNPAAERIFGYASAALLGSDLTVLLPDAYGPAVGRMAAAAVLPSIVNTRRELRGRRADGSELDAELLVTELQDDSGRYIGVVRDITTRKRAETELRESEDRFRRLADATFEGIMFHDQGTIVDANPRLAEMFGYAPAELLGMNGLELAAPASRELILRQIAAGSEAAYEVTGVRQDGSTFPFEAQGRSIRIAGRNLRVTAIRDITERKLAEAQLARAYQQAERARGETRAILDAANDAMLLVTPDGHVATINRQFCAMFGVEPQDLLGRSLDDLSDLAERIFDDMQRVVAQIVEPLQDPVGQFTDILVQQWPEPRQLELFSTPAAGAGGARLGRLYVFRDVTREREVDRMKTEFVSLVSHELRTPLTSIKGYVDLILEGEVGDINAQQEKFLTIVGNNATRLVALINDLLDISRIESGKVGLKRDRLDLAAAIQSVANSLAPQIADKQQTLTLDLPQWLPGVWGDADRVTQILTNLLSNAYKYTPVGGALRVAAHALPHTGQLRVAISDSGVGMTPEELEQLFTKFYRARNRATQDVGGTGLGLSITRSLVEMHGGQIEVTSEPGVGSTFAFTLPVLAGTGELSRAMAPLASGGHILVVEDEPDIADLLRRYLERAGYQTSVAHNAADALRLARAEQPDLITLDVQLPDGDGFGVLEALRADPRTRELLVMMLSIMPDEGQGKLLGAVDYLNKPVNERQLLERVRTLLADEQASLVLLADDDKDVRELLAGHLRRAGHRVMEAADGAEALRLAWSSAPRLALLDVKMPVMDGLAALRALREMPDTRSLPVIMMTASPGVVDGSRSAIEELGATLLIQKPFTAEELAAAIGRELEPVTPARGRLTSITGGA